MSLRPVYNKRHAHVAVGVGPGGLSRVGNHATQAPTVSPILVDRSTHERHNVHPRRHLCTCSPRILVLYWEVQINALAVSFMCALITVESAA